MGTVQVGSAHIGGERLAFISGPCVIEGADMALRTAEALRDLCARLGAPFVFKASFDKANRTSAGAFRGPGLEQGLAVLARVRAELGVPVTTDVHEPGQVAAAAEVVDLIQIPAFLCRQTDLLVAAASSGLPVNVKRGPFLHPSDLPHLLAKLEGAPGALLTERGTSFGHGDLVFDPRVLPAMRATGAGVVFDATHSAQRPGAGGHTGGDRALVPVLAAAAVAAGVDAIFAEVHPDPDRARSDAATQWPLARAEALFTRLARLHEAVQGLAKP